MINRAPLRGRIFYYETIPSFFILMPYVLKKTILSALESNDLDVVVSLAADDRTVMSRLVRMAYDKETLVGWRAIRAVGLVARSLAKNDHEFLRDVCRKLLWSLSDESGGIGWSAPEMLGEIVSADTHRFADIVPLITQVYEIEENVFRSGVLYALCRIAESAPELALPYQKIINMAIDDPDSLVKVRAIELIKLLLPWAKNNSVWSQENSERIKLSLEKLEDDRGEAWVYEKDDFISRQVGEEAQQVLKSLY